MATIEEKCGKTAKRQTSKKVDREPDKPPKQGVKDGGNTIVAPNSSEVPVEAGLKQPSPIPRFTPSVAAVLERL
jgi:hypothetical protein